MYRKEFMEMAIEEARAGIMAGDGGPFGAVIVKDGEVVATGHNRVLSNNDSTCHGEIDAIRRAEQKLETYDLAGCEIYTTGEPCPMCLAAVMWANIEKVYYGCTLEDNAEIGFRDEKFDKLMGERANLPEGLLEEKDRELCLELFDEYKKMGETIY
jgi:tRNA(Arg) A34 adenosine deaminase TadA